MQANKALDAFLKTLRKDREIAGVVQKETLTQEIVEELSQSGQLGPADTKKSVAASKQNFFYVSLYFGKRGRETKEKWPSRCSFWVASIMKSTVA